MSDAKREVTGEEILAVAAKLSPAFQSLTEDEREVFALAVDRATVADSEVSAFDQGRGFQMETLVGLTASPRFGGSGGPAQGMKLSIFHKCSKTIDCCNQPGGGSGL